MANVTIYTTPYCGFCRRAKLFLTSKNIPFREVDVSDYAQREELEARTKWPTVPQIFIGDEFIGGSDELQALDDEGRLDAMLAA